MDEEIGEELMASFVDVAGAAEGEVCVYDLCLVELCLITFYLRFRTSLPGSMKIIITVLLKMSWRANEFSFDDSPLFSRTSYFDIHIFKLCRPVFVCCSHPLHSCLFCLSRPFALPLYNLV